MTGEGKVLPARSAEVQLRLLRDPLEMTAASELVAQVWQVGNAHSHVSPELLTALAHSDNYVAGAFQEGELVAACVGFFYPPTKLALHSHIAGVRADVAGTGVGNALKFHQRAWCLQRGVTRATWTYDPLVARNAYFNIHKLGCQIDDYLPDFYGTMDDTINQGQHSDRLMAVWRLDQEVVRTVGDPGPVVLRSVGGHPHLELEKAVAASRCRVEIPSDIEAVRRETPTLAAEWRLALRRVLAGLLREGWSVVDFDRQGHYYLRRKD
ncbi:GNAT family N-acetyltransferase [Rhodococcus erythropolis]|uniref:GNAT family N-acetyltransferase n=1 Tax=Rhodococcus erythropolis TaxID=1833 RepID=UPI003789CF3F